MLYEVCRGYEASTLQVVRRQSVLGAAEHDQFLINQVLSEVRHTAKSPFTFSCKIRHTARPLPNQRARCYPRAQRAQCTRVVFQPPIPTRPHGIRERELSRTLRSISGNHRVKWEPRLVRSGTLLSGIGVQHTHGIRERELSRTLFPNGAWYFWQVHEAPMPHALTSPLWQLRHRRMCKCRSCSRAVLHMLAHWTGACALRSLPGAFLDTVRTGTARDGWRMSGDGACQLYSGPPPQAAALEAKGRLGAGRSSRLPCVVGTRRGAALP